MRPELHEFYLLEVLSGQREDVVVPPSQSRQLVDMYGRNCVFTRPIDRGSERRVDRVGVRDIVALEELNLK